MPFTPPFHYQWQNPRLCKTIYPFRLEKLRDFLLFYREIDLWRELRSQPVDPQVGEAIRRARQDLQDRLETARKLLPDTKQRLKNLDSMQRSFTQRPEVRQLAARRAALKEKQARKTKELRPLRSSVAWYQKRAEQHPEVLESPAYLHRLAQLAEVEAACRPLEDGLAQIAAEEQALRDQAGLGTYDADRQALLEAIREQEKHIAELQTGLGRLPELGPAGEVTPGACVRWMLLAYERELLELDHAGLVRAVLERFDAEPGRFPRWLQYMVLHFSGMRYKSAHGSWASPQDLLQELRLQEKKDWLQHAAPEELEAAAQQAVAELQTRLAGAQPGPARRIQARITSLNNPLTRKTALKNYYSEIIPAQVQALSDDQALEGLKDLREQIPGWAWKEIVSRTRLRLETQDENWDTLTPEELRERYSAESARWREIMNYWTRKDITAWRKKHELTRALVVTRAVCNEIAEHILHLRGLQPGAGLTAKPAWYLRLQKKAAVNPAAFPDPPYLRLPGQRTAADFKSGASILWLGWVDRPPNMWQITRALPELTTLPPVDTHGGWVYSSAGGVYTRFRQAAVAGPGGGSHRRPRPAKVKQWLRWTHEAIVVEVAEMADGKPWVLTFETGEIGLRRRPLAELLNNPYVYVGYAPDGTVNTELLDTMLERSRLLPGRALRAPVTEQLRGAPRGKSRVSKVVPPEG